jgi:hypothetical protein
MGERGVAKFVYEAWCQECAKVTPHSLGKCLTCSPVAEAGDGAGVGYSRTPPQAREPFAEAFHTPKNAVRCLDEATDSKCVPARRIALRERARTGTVPPRCHPCRSRLLGPSSSGVYSTGEGDE